MYTQSDLCKMTVCTFTLNYSVFIQVLFGDSEGYIGVFENVYPNNKKSSGVAAVTDTLADDSLLMEVL